MKNRDFSLDLIRIFACLLVVLMHAPMPSANANGPFLSALSFFTAPCIGLFFMVSGALLLPVKQNFFTFMKRRLSRIVIPTMVWTIVYLSLNIYCDESEINILQSIFSVPFSAQGHGVLWFMYTLTGLYVLAPILSEWVKKASNRELEFVLLLWCVTLCYPFLKLLLVVNTGTTGILYYFTGYAGYFLLGYYLKYRADRFPVIYPAIISMLGIWLIIYLKINQIEFDFYQLFWYESIFISSMCCVIWWMLKKLTDKLSGDARNFPLSGGGIVPYINELSNLSFGIYLMHILIMRYWLWRMEWIMNINSYPLQTLVVAIMTIIITVAICLLLSTIPLAKVLTGYRKH